jgi:Domain of unknown function (DUF4157)
MRTLTTKQSAKDSTKQIHDRTRSTLTPLEMRSNNISTGMPLIQRQCACGGGCPRCQDNPTLQTKLKISEPGDVYEQEADRVADEVMRMPEPTIQRQMEPEKDVEEMVQTKAISNSITPLQRSSTDPNQSVEVPEIVNDVLRSPGQPLDSATLALMEPRFGHDFSQVRIHTGGDADRSARDINANAYTVGHNIVFAEGQFTPDTHQGRRLISHELTHVVQQHTSKINVQRQPTSPAGGGGSTPPARVVYIDANVIIQINRGNQSVANALRQMRSSGVEVRISPFQYNELVNNPEIPRTATAQRLMLQEMNITQGASPTQAQRVDTTLAGETGSGNNIMQIRDQQLVASARAGGRNVEIWSLDTPFTSNPRQVENTYGVRVAPESQLPLATNSRPDYRVGRQLLGLQPVQISLTGQVTRNPPPLGGGSGGVPGGGTPPPGTSTPGTIASPGARIVAGGVGIIMVVNEILGGINQVRGIQQKNIDIGYAGIAFWEKFGAKPTSGIWDLVGQHPLPSGTTPSTSILGSPSFPYVVDIDINALRNNLSSRIDSYQDFLYFLDAGKTLGTIQEDPPMPNSPDRLQRSASRRYYAWVNQPDRAGRHSYDITDVILQVRTAALGELEEGMREQAMALSPEQQRNIYRLKNGPETQIFRSAGGLQLILTSQQIFGSDPWVRTTGQQRDVGGLLSTDMRIRVVPANADAQRAALISGYWVKQPIEDTLDEVRAGGRPILDRQPAQGSVNSFVAGPEPGSHSRFGQTRYYRHPDPNFRWTVALGELHEFWVKRDDLVQVPDNDITAFTRKR